MGRLIIAPTIEPDAFKRFGFLLELVNQQSRDTSSSRRVTRAKMNNARPPARDSVKKIAKAIAIGFQGDNYLAEFCVFLERALWEKAQRLRV
jgi:hypothetical protein